MLTSRKEHLLKIIVGDYIATAMPVGSESIAKRYHLDISPATIRHEMSHLEEEGYITHPYTSAGRVPSDKGYRYYIEALMDRQGLAAEERQFIRQELQRTEREIEMWGRLAAMLLAQLVRNVGLVTLPKAAESRLKHLEIISLQDFLVMLVLVLHEARVKQQILTMEEAVTQDELTSLANKLNAAYAGLGSSQILARTNPEASLLEELVTRAIVRLMQGEDERAYDDLYWDGLRHMLNQPEFTNAAKMRTIVEVFEDKDILVNILSQSVGYGDVQVIIGAENKHEAVQECSIVLTHYGIPGEIRGTIGVFGPTRMHYERVVSSVSYVASVLSELLSEVYG